MRVYTAKIIGFFVGFLFGGTVASQIEVLSVCIGLITVVEIFRVRGQLLKGPWVGFVFGILAGYFLRNLVS
jgi:hypothetical protein